MFAKIFIFIATTYSFLAVSQASVSLSIDDSDCVNGWLSMDVSVSVDGEDFNFSPSCNFTFSDSFKTSTGVECKIESGMCSSFMGAEQIRVDCGSSGSASDDFECPGRK